MILSVYRKNSFRDWWALHSTCVSVWVKLMSSRHSCCLISALVFSLCSLWLHCALLLPGSWSGSFDDYWSENFPLCNMCIQCYQFTSRPHFICAPQINSISICVQLEYLSSLEIFFFDPWIIQKGVVQVSDVRMFACFQSVTHSEFDSTVVREHPVWFQFF